MELSPAMLKSAYEAIHRKRQSRHLAEDRREPSIFAYDYLMLRSLSRSMEDLLARLPAGEGRLALDLGASRSPYRNLVESSGYQLKTLDIDSEHGADYVGTAEQTGLPAGTFDLIICTQVLEHCLDPFAGMREMARILKPGGFLLFSAPHVWFYHPHPSDNWRFTQEGMVRLCEHAGLNPVALQSQGGSGTAFFQIASFLAYGLLGRCGAPIYLGCNILGRLADRVVANSLFCLNFACLASRP